MPSLTLRLRYPSRSDLRPSAVKIVCRRTISRSWIARKIRHRKGSTASVTTVEDGDDAAVSADTPAGMSYRNGTLHELMLI
jgi:hypothetical protein